MLGLLRSESAGAIRPFGGMISIFATHAVEDTSREYGPFAEVRLTYNLLRVGEGLERELAEYKIVDDVWVFDDGFEATDVELGVAHALNA